MTLHQEPRIPGHPGTPTAEPLAPGTALRPAEIADTLRVSVSPEALIPLSERGLASNARSWDLWLQSDSTTSANYCRLLTQLCRDSLGTIARAAVTAIAARQFTD
ncbi:hypothetical protein [Mesorhizobium sp. KR1-2]|uniref:hypothetical protein n=1 Tax=Mesorhizobium sp. KR1-2 TaxID=3156609 RepID=UPI0032B454EE